MNRATAKYKGYLFILFAFVYTLFYIFPNFHPLTEPVLLPLLAIDRAVPFLPWTFIIYTSDYVMIFFSICLIKSVEEFNSFSRMMFCVLFISGLVFIFYPTTYPRPIYPNDENPYIQLLMWLVGTADTPNNCFPSMHVGLTAVSAWVMRKTGKFLSPLFALWAFAIFVSTLTTKQHYFVDILGGLAVCTTVVILEYFLQHWRSLTLSRTKAAP